MKKTKAEDKTYDPFTSQEVKDLMLGKSEEVDEEHNLLIVERFADNGAHSHWVLIDKSDGGTLWSEAPEEELSHPHTDEGKERYEAAMEYVDECTRDMDSIDTTMVAKIASGYNPKGE